MSAHDDIVRRLAELAGIADAFTDVFGRVVETPIETRRAILAAFGFPAATEAEGRASLERLQALREGLIPPLVTLEANRPASVRVRARDGVQAMSFVLVDEDGTTREGRAALSGDAIELPALPAGYYRLEVTAGSAKAQATVIAAPTSCFEPEALRDGRAPGASPPRSTACARARISASATTPTCAASPSARGCSGPRSWA
jgi:(1->4)-alpha-D-glucan 1-alpha-D-glucosylmutase